LAPESPLGLLRKVSFIPVVLVVQIRCSSDQFPRMIEQVGMGNTKADPVAPNDTIYLCNFRVSVDGEWLCLKELQELGDITNTFPPTPELERITYYPNYPVGPRERDPVLIERSNLVNISKLVVKEVIESSLKFGRQLDSDHIPLQHFFIVLEHVLRHGLRPKKGLLGPKKELWDLLQKVEKLDAEAADITASVRDLPTVRTAIGRARAWLRLALMQKKLSDYFRLLVAQHDMLAEFYEPPSLLRSDEANLINALLVSLNVVDCNLCVKEEELDSQQGVIDFSLYLRSKREMGDDTSSLRSDQESEADSNMSTVLDQKNYIEELNRHLNATVTSLQAKVEGLTTTNALMKEDLSISRKSVDKIQAENRRLKNELEKFRKIEKKSESWQDLQQHQNQAGQEDKRTSVVQMSYESGIKELSQEFRVRLQEELIQREEVEKQLEKQNALKKQMEVSIQQLEEDVTEKQTTIGSLKSQLEDIKCINLEMYTKLAECEYEISQKGELVAKLETKTKEISQMLTNLNNMNLNSDKKNDKNSEKRNDEPIKNIERSKKVGVSTKKDGEIEKVKDQKEKKCEPEKRLENGDKN